MTSPLGEIQVLNVDHLGIVAGMVDEIGWVEQINQLLGNHPQEVVSLGQVLKAMLLNGLGFVSAPLYLFEQFFIGKATEHLIGEGVQPEHLNDDRLGRALDKFHDYGVTKLFTALAMKADQQYGVSIESVHLDSSSFAVEGQYHVKPPVGTADAATGSNEETGVIQITYGYSRDHRPDLKQFLMDMICSADGDVPLYLRLGDGNEADKAVFVQVMQQYQQQWQFEGLFVVDSSLYGAENLQQLGQLHWLTRVPFTLKQAKLALHGIAEDDWMESGRLGLPPGRTTQSLCSGGATVVHCRESATP